MSVVVVIVIVIVIITPSPPQWRSGGGDAATMLCRAVIQSLSVTTISSPPKLQVGFCVMGGLDGLHVIILHVVCFCCGHCLPSLSFVVIVLCGCQPLTKGMGGAAMALSLML